MKISASRSLAPLSLIFLTTLLSCGVNTNRSTLSADPVPFDNDGDGIGPLSDRCPNTDFEAVRVVDAHGCGSDDKDGDGVPDEYDQCPQTPAGATVTKWDGCMTKYFMGSVNIVTVSDDGSKSESPIYAFGYETTAEAVKASVMSLIDQAALLSNQYLSDLKATAIDIAGANTDPCKLYACGSSSPSTGGSLGSSGNYGSASPGPIPAPADAGSSTPASTGGDLSTTPAVSPTIVVGASLTTPIDSEELANDLLNYGFTALSSDPNAAKLVSLMKTQNAVASNLTENLRAPQVSQIASYFNNLSFQSLKIADQLFAANRAPEAEAYMYVASVLIDATYDLANSNVATRLGSNEEVPSIYRNLYEAFSGQNVLGPESIDQEKRARALAELVTSEIGKKMLQPGTQAAQVGSFGVLFKRLIMATTGEEELANTLIEAAKTI